MDTRVSPAVVVVVLVLVAAILVALYYIVFAPSQTTSDASQSEAEATGALPTYALAGDVPSAGWVRWSPSGDADYSPNMNQRAEPL